MGKIEPYISLPNDLSAISKTIKENNLDILDKLFIHSDCLFPASNNVYNFFLNYSNDELQYDLPSVKQALEKVKTSLFMSNDQFSPLFSSYLPTGTSEALAELLKAEIATCFTRTFNSNNQLHPWIKNIFTKKEYATLLAQFGEVAFHFKLLSIITKKHADQFKTKIIPSDEACSTVIIELLHFELSIYHQLSKSIANLGRLLENTDNGYKSKENALVIFNQAKTFFFKNHFLAHNDIKQYIDKLCQVIESPHNINLVNELKNLGTEIKYETNNNYLYLFISAACLFLGSFLIVSGVLNAPLLPLSPALIASGFLFFSGGVTLFNQGLGKEIALSIEDFNNEAEKNAFSA